MSNADVPLTGEGATGTDDEKLQGIAEQVLQDIRAGYQPTASAATLLEERITQVGLEVPADTIAELAERIEADAAR